VHTLQTFTNSNSAPQISAAMTPGQSDYLIFGKLKVVRWNVPHWWNLAGTL